MKYFEIDTSTGKMTSDLDRQQFITMCKNYQHQGIKKIYNVIRKSKPTSDKMKNFFFVQCHYITAQDVGTQNYTKDDYESRRRMLQNKFLRIPLNLTKSEFKNGDKIPQDQSLAKAKKNNTFDLVENVNEWAILQGYKMPISDEFFELCGGGTSREVELAKETLKDRLRVFLEATSQDV